jgi:hypothetical protein
VIVVLARGRHIGSVFLFVITCVTATGLAAVSFHLVEHPLRTSRVLDRYRGPVVAAGFMASLLFGILVVPAVLDDHGSSALSVPRGSTSRQLLDWRVARGDGPRVPDCLDAAVERCTITTGTRQRILLMGDSHAEMWIPAFEQIAKEESMTFAVAAMAGCPWQRGLFYEDLGPFTDVAKKIYRSCRRHQADWYERIVPQFKPDIIVLAHPAFDDPKFPLDLTFPDGRKMGVGDTDYEQALIDASAVSIRALRATNRELVILEPVPSSGSFNPLNCLSKGGPVEKCAYQAAFGPTPLERFYRALSQPPNVSAVNVDKIVCPRLPICDPIVNDVIVRRDANSHLTATFARSVSRAIQKLLQTNGILGVR